MSGDQHPFKTWLLANHIDEDTPTGDLARDVQSDSRFPSEGDRQDVRRYLQEGWGAESVFLVCFEETWRLYEPDGSPGDHPFTTWLLRRNLWDNTQLSGFAVAYANIFPATGDRQALRSELEDVAGAYDSWELDCFDAAWKLYRPQCEAPGCNLAVDSRMSLCREHTLEELL